MLHHPWILKKQRKILKSVKYIQSLFKSNSDKRYTFFPNLLVYELHFWVRFWTREWFTTFQFSETKISVLWNRLDFWLYVLESLNPNLKSVGSGKVRVNDYWKSKGSKPLKRITHPNYMFLSSLTSNVHLISENDIQDHLKAKEIKVMH